MSQQTPFSIVCRTAAFLLGCHATEAEDIAEGFNWIMPVIHHEAFAAGFGVDRELPEDLHGQPGEFSRTVVRGFLRLQPYATKQDEVQVTGSVNRSEINSQASFPQTGAIPHRLIDDRIGIAYRHVQDRSVYGVTTTVGSASEQPFSHSSSLIVSASIFDRIPVRTQDAWIVSLVYSNDRAVLNNIPVPAVMYQWQASPSTILIAGFPILAILWKSSDRFGAEAVVSGFGSTHVAAFEVPSASVPWLKLRIGADYGGEVYRRNDASDQSDRIIFRSLRLAMGCTVERGRSASASFFVGYAVFREIIEGRSLFSSGNSIQIRPTPVFGGMAVLRL